MASLDIVPGWKCYSKSATHLTNVCRYCPFLPYLSLVVPRNSAVKTSRKVVVRRIVFTTTSHDQGQLDDKSLEGKSEGKLEGKYDGSQTWFSARVLDPAGRDRFPEQRIHTNVAASREFRTHVNCWDHREPAGQGKWLSSIESGDHIQIVPTASRDGWVNFIQGARIDIWVEEIDQKPDLEHGLLGSQDPSVYRPLSLQRKEIRLVVIEPQDNDDDTIRVSLQYLSLDEPEGTPFEALSYCWGSVQDLKPIMMKNPDASKPDFEFQVTSNLFSALKHLRRPHVSRTFWIDLICINQSNIEERNKQVGLMGRIFALAKHVRVWLGEFDEEVAAEFAIMRTIARKQQNPELLADASLESLPAHMPRTHSDIFSDKAITPHDKVFQKPWFYRIWVLQEVWSSSLISPSDEIDRVTVQHGHNEVPWNIILQANICLRYYRWENVQRMPVVWEMLFLEEKSPGSSQKVYKSSPRIHVVSMAISGLDMQATDRRDNIFALLGFAKETHNIEELPDLVRPNYHKSIIDVYSDFTRWWIEHRRTLGIFSVLHALTGRTWVDMLGFGSSGDDEDEDVNVNSPQLPSWAWWYNGRSIWALSSLAADLKALYQACGDSKVDVDFMRCRLPSDPKVLALRGIRIGSVSSISYYPGSETASKYPNLERAFRHIFDPADLTGTWRYARSLTHFEPSSVERGFRWCMSTHDKAHEEIGMSSDDTRFPCYGKCFFKMEDGNFGLCPAGTKLGDVVTILYGGRVPFLLRPTKDSTMYKLVGECYVEGLMYGEALPSADNMRREEEFLLV